MHEKEQWQIEAEEDAAKGEAAELDAEAWEELLTMQAEIGRQLRDNGTYEGRILSITDAL